MSPACFPPTVSGLDARFPPQGPLGWSVPASSVLSGATTPHRPSRRTSFPSLGGTIHARTVRSPRWSVPHRGAGGFCSPRRYPPGDLISDGNDRASHVPGEPAVSMPCSSTPAGSSAPGLSGATTRPPLEPRRRLPRSQFRGSITRPGHSLSTLRRMDRSTTTQDSLPATGQVLPDGIGYPLGSNERFQSL